MYSILYLKTDKWDFLLVTKTLIGLLGIGKNFFALYFNLKHLQVLN